jgi:putative lipoprotein
MKSLSRLLAVAAALSLLVACGQAQSPEPQPVGEEEVAAVDTPNELEDTRWVAESITGEPSAEGVTSTVAFAADGKVSGNAGCNDYFGSYALEGDSIGFGHMGATQKMCVHEEFMEQEARFLEALNRAERYSVDDGVLVIYSTGHDEPTRMMRATSTGVVTGAVFYRAPIALPPDATIIVKLVDVARADAPAVVLAGQKIVPEGSVPVAFELEYDPAQIDARMSYAVQARIEAGGRLMFTTTQMIPVITRDSPTEGVQVLVQRVQ